MPRLNQKMYAPGNPPRQSGGLCLWIAIILLVAQYKFLLVHVGNYYEPYPCLGVLSS